MSKYPRLKTVVLFVFIIIFAAGLSVISIRLWGGKAEVSSRAAELIIENNMTVGQFGEANKLDNRVLKEIFDLKSKSDLDKKINDYGTADQISSRVNKELALASEEASKNWVKIPVKFATWIIFLIIVFSYFKKRKVTSELRKTFLFLAILIFGVALGSDPGPMGTVKDAIHLFGTNYVIFPPRMIALTIFLIMVLLANKYICSWGCQLGTLQDFIFRINRDDKNKGVLGRQIKLPFAFTNTLRVLFFAIFTAIAFAWGLDIVEPVDPFKIFNPEHLAAAGAVFIIILLLLGLFVYRPWCHLFCPFGLVGWLVEKISIVKIKVNYETCIACKKCAAVCPSTVMSAILQRDKKTIPDCFSCYTCRDICPTNSISFSFGKRSLSPEGHFDKKK